MFGHLCAAVLQCEPYYADWSNVGTLHVYHPAIVPCAASAYTIQAIEEGCDVVLAQSYSTPWALSTSGWADVVGLFDGTEWGAPDGEVTVVSDVLAILGKFTNQTNAVSKARVDLHPATPDQIIGILRNSFCMSNGAAGMISQKFVSDRMGNGFGVSHLPCAECIHVCDQDR